MSRESLGNFYQKQIPLNFGGSIDDDETLEAVRHWIEKIDFSKLDPMAPQQITAIIGETQYYICESDIGGTIEEFRARIKQHRDRRFLLDRRHKDRRQGDDRRQSDDRRHENRRSGDPVPPGSSPPAT